jgi:ligand-binding sensor domain-containing protein
MGLVSDQDGDLWVATAMNGLAWLDGKRPVNRSDWRFLTVENSGLCSDKIMALLVDSHGDLWVGTREGLCRYVDGKWDQPVSADLKDAEIKVLFEDSQGGLWVGTDTGGRHWNGETWQALPSMPGWEGEDYVAAFFEDSRGNIWAGVKETTMRYNGQTWVEVFPDFRGRVFEENSDQILWIGGEDGLVQYNLDSGVEQRYSTENSTLSGDSIQDLVIDADGTLWISTFDFEIDDQPVSLWVLSGLSVLLFALLAGMVIISQQQTKAL